MIYAEMGLSGVSPVWRLRVWPLHGPCPDVRGPMPGALGAAC